jgi:hypothetical protein
MSNTGKAVVAVGILGGLAAAIGLAASSGKKNPQRMAGAPLRRKRDCNCGR